MQGQVVHVAMEGSEGFIRAEDSRRYPYAMSDWISLEPASVGASVDFELVENLATMVCKITEIVAAQSNDALPFWKRKGFQAAAGTLALLTIGTGVAYETGMLAGLTNESPGQIKTFQVLRLAKIRNMPTAQNSAVMGELNPGDNFVGRVYLGPDGQSQWIKREGVEEYVSIINLAEVATPQAAPSLQGGLSAPNNEEAEKAANIALSRIPGAIIRAGPVGVPKNCTPGTMNGQEVVSCSVCADFLLVTAFRITKLNQIVPMRVSLFIPFKRAISYDQPDVAPIDKSSGVWVGNFPSSNQFPVVEPPRYTVEARGAFSSDDIPSLNGTSVSPDGFIGNSFMQTYVPREDVLRALGNPQYYRLIVQKVGSCALAT